MWFPLTNPKTGSLELCVVAGGVRPTSSYPTKAGGRVNFVLSLKRRVFPIDADGANHASLTPSNTLVDLLASEKSRRPTERDETGRRRKNGRPRAHVFEIPELYVNARPYEDIEAEEEARAAAAKEESNKEATIAFEAEEQEALIAVAAAALAARAARDTREVYRFLQVPERF